MTVSLIIAISLLTPRPASPKAAQVIDWRELAGKKVARVKVSRFPAWQTECEMERKRPFKRIFLLRGIE